MAPSFEWTASSLLCAEDNNTVFGDDDSYGAVEEQFEATWHHENRRINRQDSAFGGGGYGELPMQSKECLALMVTKECQHLPKADYLMRLKTGDLDLGARKDAIIWIGKTHAHFGFGPLCAYLSINYLDRFLSATEPADEDWMMQLVAIACLSLAAKMEEIQVPLSPDLQVCGSKYIFEAGTIQEMEILVLTTLGWRMQAITPFSFIDNFLSKINNDETPPRSLIQQSIQLILSTTIGIEFLEFRPSEIAAAVAIALVGEIKTMDAEQAISVLTQYVEKEKVVKCIELVREISLICDMKDLNASILCMPQSPNGVLDAACLSYRSDDTTVGSCANSPEAKRIRLTGHWQM